MPSSRTGRGNAVFRAMLRTWPVWIVVVLGSWLIWPAPIGTMPLSHDHTVHFARAWMVGQNLADGHVAGWSSYWFFGFPLGEFYPVVGDLAVALVRGASFGLLSWPACYALAFTAGYLLQGIALLGLSRALGLGPLPGLVAAALNYLDPGAPQEGGWTFTADYGVWLQPMACALVWWAFAELDLALRPDRACRPRKLVLAAALVGLAILSHAIALPMIGLGALLFLLFLGSRAGVGRMLVATGLAIGLGVCLAAWWFVPLLANRGWMASKAMLGRDLDTMVTSLVAGSWAQHMSPLVGYGILAGLVWAWLRGPRFAKFVATFAVLLWWMSSSEAFFLLRLDWLSEAFSLVHYPRVVLCAKPGLFMAAGALVGVLARRGSAAWRRGTGLGQRALRAAPGLGAALVALGALTTGAVLSARSGDVGRLSTTRVEDAPEFERTWAAFNEWARARWEERDAFFRFAFEDGRSSHVFADSPAFSHAPSYKIGFTPGDLFVHMVESGEALVLDRLRVRYLVGASAPRGSKIVRRFGPLKVVERPVQERIARLVGTGEMEVLRDDPDGAGVVVRLANVGAGARLEFNLAGHARWQALHDGAPVEWYEVPVVGTGPFATQSQRRAGELRANRLRGVEPTDPILLAVDARDGTYELRYRRWMAADVLGVSVFALGLFACGFMLARPAASARVVERVRSALRPRVLWAGACVLVLAVLALYARGFRRESSLASGWLRAGRADDVTGMRNGPLDVDHVLGPAVLATAETDEPAQLVLPGLPSGDRAIAGWVAIGDLAHATLDARARIELLVEGRPSGGGDEDFVPLLEQGVVVRTGKQAFTIPTRRLGADEIDLRVSVRIEAGTTPRMGFDLEL